MTLDKCNFEQTPFSWDLTCYFYNIFKRAITLFLTRNRLPAKKQENCNPAQKMVEKFGKSWVLLIHLSPLSHIID